MPNSFPAHGHFALTLEGRILVNRARGPWNTELVIAYGQAVAEATKALYGEPWVVLAFVSGKPIHTPDAKDQMVAALKEHRAHGRCGTVLMFQDVEGEGLIRLIQSSIYSAAGEPYLFATDENEARDWLQQQLTRAKRGARL